MSSELIALHPIQALEKPYFAWPTELMLLFPLRLESHPGELKIPLKKTITPISKRNSIS